MGNAARTEFIRNGAERAADMSKWIGSQLNETVKPTFLTLNEVLAGHSGFFTHATADPSRRTDPGTDFPKEQFLTQYKAFMSGTPETPPPPPPPSNNDSQILAEIRQMLQDNGYTLLGDLVRDFHARGTLIQDMTAVFKDIRDQADRF
jgi:hypothetical protein